MQPWLKISTFKCGSRVLFIAPSCTWSFSPFHTGNGGSHPADQRRSNLHSILPVRDRTIRIFSSILNVGTGLDSKNKPLVDGWKIRCGLGNKNMVWMSSRWIYDRIYQQFNTAENMAVWKNYGYRMCRRDNADDLLDCSYHRKVWAVGMRTGYNIKHIGYPILGLVLVK